MDFVIFDPALFAIATDATGSSTAAGTLYHCKLRLFQSNIAIDKSVTLATLNAASATFAGYADETITWNSPSRAEDGTIEVIGTAPAFIPSDTVTPNNIWGCYLVDQAGDLALAAQFDNPPVPMVDTHSILTITVRYRPADNTTAVVIS